jgi:hypothetical protein
MSDNSGTFHNSPTKPTMALSRHAKPVVASPAYAAILPQRIAPGRRTSRLTC